MSKKIRKTIQRSVIKDIISRSNCHPTAEWVYAEARKVIPNLSLGTVYRNLRVMKEIGEIEELDFGSAVAHYDGNPSTHYHFCCQKCNKIYDIELNVQNGLEDKVKSQGFAVNGHRLEFYGLCQTCQNSDK